MVAASNYYKIGTVVTVSTPENGRTINVVINDHGPSERDPITHRALKPLRPDPEVRIDLAPAAMEALTGSRYNKIWVKMRGNRPEYP
jgi:hypothetical protein